MGKDILFDEEMKPILSQFNWRIQKNKHGFYAIAHAYIGGKRTTIWMHRLIMGFPSKLVDHRNGNGLDNRIGNLRLATKSENVINRKFNNKHGFRGVFTSNGGKLFQAKIKQNKELIYIGSFATAEAAAKAYDKKAKELHGDFAILNFPGESE